MAEVEYRTGDLFAQEDLGAIGHGVNLQGKMGAGIAALFAKKLPKMKEEYSEMCDEQLLQLGSVFFWREHGDIKAPFVANIATQVETGADARLNALEVGMFNAVRECEYQGITSLGVPRIGAGIGGLKWDDVKEVFEQVAKTTDVKIVVVSLD